MRADSHAWSGFPTQPAVNFDYSSVTSARCRIRALCGIVGGKQNPLVCRVSCCPSQPLTSGQQDSDRGNPEGFCFGVVMTPSTDGIAPGLTADPDKGGK